MTEQHRRDIRRKLRVLNDVNKWGSIARTCRHYGVARATFYIWKNKYKTKGEDGLINRKPCPENPRLRIAAPIQEKIFHLRKTYHFGPVRISWYLERYHGLKVSQGGIRKVLERKKRNEPATAK